MYPVLEQARCIAVGHVKRNSAQGYTERMKRVQKIP